MFDPNLALEELASRRGIQPFDEFRLKAIVPMDKTLAPLSIALIVGVVLKLTGFSDWFNDNESLFWGACFCYFITALMIERYHRRLLLEAYELYLWRFDEPTLRSCFSHPLVLVRDDMEVRQVMKRHIQRRFEPQGDEQSSSAK